MTALDNHRDSEILRDRIWQSFRTFDTAQEGVIRTRDLHRALEHLGEEVSDDETFRMIAICDPQNEGTIGFEQFRNVVMTQKQEKAGTLSEEDLLDAYVAMGGDEDGGGCVDATKLIKTIKEEF